jgi:hypothetical protein
MADDRRNGLGRRTASTRCSRRRGRLRPATIWWRGFWRMRDGRAGLKRGTRTAARRGLFGARPSWIAALGGWGGFGGVTAAGLVGLAVGFWSPDMVDVLSGGQIWSLSGGG